MDLRIRHEVHKALTRLLRVHGVITNETHKHLDAAIDSLRPFEDEDDEDWMEQSVRNEDEARRAHFAERDAHLGHPHDMP